MSKWSHIGDDGKPVAHYTVTVDLPIPDEWFEFCYAFDLFEKNYCGYWMFGIEHDDKLGWLVFETGGEEMPDEDMIFLATFIWKRNHFKGAPDLPEGFMSLTDEVMARAYQIAVEKWGISWEDNADALTYDYIIQMALLGETRYG